jgi:hypothetical protein
MLYGDAVNSRPYISHLKIVNIFPSNLVFGGLELNGRNSFFVHYWTKINVNLQLQIGLKQFYITPSVSENQQNETLEFTGIFAYDLQLVSYSFSTVHNKHGLSVWVQNVPFILFPISLSDNTHSGHIRRPRIFQQKTVAPSQFLNGQSHKSPTGQYSNIIS